MRAWMRWRREVRTLRRDVDFAYRRWVNSRYLYEDVCKIYRGQRGAYGNAGAIGLAMAEVSRCSDEYRDLNARLQRLVELGP